MDPISKPASWIVWTVHTVSTSPLRDYNPSFIFTLFTPLTCRYEKTNSALGSNTSAWLWIAATKGSSSTTCAAEERKQEGEGSRKGLSLGPVGSSSTTCARGERKQEGTHTVWAGTKYIMGQSYETASLYRCVSYPITSSE